MHFVISFTQRNEEAMLKKAGSFAFDLDSYMKSQYARFIDRVLERRINFKQEDLQGAVSEYLKSRGYSTTNLKMLHDEDAFLDDCYIAKKKVFGCLHTLNIMLAVKLLKAHRKYIRNPKQVWLLIHMCSLLKMVRSELDTKSLAQWMNRHLNTYKGCKVEVLSLSGRVDEIEMTVAAADGKTYTYELLVRTTRDRNYDIASNKMKKLLIDRIMLEFGTKRCRESYQGTCLEKMLIHFRLLQKELEKEGVLPFNKFI